MVESGTINRIATGAAAVAGAVGGASGAIAGAGAAFENTASRFVNEGLAQGLTYCPELLHGEQASQAANGAAEIIKNCSLADTSLIERLYNHLATLPRTLNAYGDTLQSSYQTLRNVLGGSGFNMPQVPQGLAQAYQGLAQIIENAPPDGNILEKGKVGLDLLEYVFSHKDALLEGGKYLSSLAQTAPEGLTNSILQMQVAFSNMETVLQQTIGQYDLIKNTPMPSGWKIIGYATLGLILGVVLAGGATYGVGKVISSKVGSSNQSDRYGDSSSGSSYNW